MQAATQPFAAYAGSTPGDGMDMKNFVVNAPKTMQLVSLPPAPPKSGSAKVRVTKSGLCFFDLASYNGTGQLPIVPGRQGAGVISEIAEDNIYGLNKGDRVLITPYLPCGECFYCKTEQPSRCENMRVLAKNTDGLWTDFKNLPMENLMLLPAQVDDRAALFAESISIAIEVLDALGIEKGDQIAIVGGNVLANVLAQLAIYYQAIPVLIDNNAKNLEKAAECGIYYTVSGDADVGAYLNQVTGGRLAKYVVYVSGAKKSISNALSYCAKGGTVAVTGFAAPAMTADISMVLKNQLRIVTADNGYSNFASAINLLATGAVDVLPLISETVAFADVPDYVAKNADGITADQLFFSAVDCLDA